MSAALIAAALAALEALEVAAVTKRADGTYLDNDCTFTMAITHLRAALAAAPESIPAIPQIQTTIELCVGDNGLIAGVSAAPTGLPAGIYKFHFTKPAEEQQK